MATKTATGIAKLASILMGSGNTTEEVSEKKQSVQEYLDSINSEQKVLEAIKKLVPAGATEDTVAEIKRKVVVAYIKNKQREEEERDKKYKYVVELALKRAADVAGATSTEIDNKLWNSIMELNSIGEKLKYVDAANMTQKWVTYAIWVCTDPKAIGLVNIDPEIKRLVNGVCQALHCELQYKDEGCYDIEAFDPMISGFNNQRFLLNSEAIKKLCTINFLERVRRKNNPNPTTPEGIKLTQPVKLKFEATSANTLIDPLLQVDEYTANVVGTTIAPYLNGREYYVTKAQEPNMVKLYITNPNNGIDEEYKMIIGWHGLGTASLVTTNNLGGTVIIPAANTELFKKVLSNYFYQVNEVDTNENLKFQSQFFWIYQAIDMSKIPGDQITPYLDAVINAVFYQLQQNGVKFTGRMRFESFKNNNDFSLTSDQYVPLPFGGITDGSFVIVKDSKACYKLGNSIVTVTY